MQNILYAKDLIVSNQICHFLMSNTQPRIINADRTLEYPTWTGPWNIADWTLKYRGLDPGYNWADTREAKPHSP